MRTSLGGDISIGEKMILVRAKLRPLMPHDLGWRWQCRCGGWLYVKYRGRFYCHVCGRRIQHPDILTVSHEHTFRQAYEAAGPPLARRARLR